MKAYGAGGGIDVSGGSRDDHLTAENLHTVENRHRGGGEFVVLELHEAEFCLLGYFILVEQNRKLRNETKTMKKKPKNEKF